MRFRSKRERDRDRSSIGSSLSSTFSISSTSTTATSSTPPHYPASPPVIPCRSSSNADKQARFQATIAHLTKLLTSQPHAEELASSWYGPSASKVSHKSSSSGSAVISSIDGNFSPKARKRTSSVPGTTLSIPPVSPRGSSGGHVPRNGPGMPASPRKSSLPAAKPIPMTMTLRDLKRLLDTERRVSAGDTSREEAAGSASTVVLGGDSSSSEAVGLPTPSLSHLSKADYDKIYEPAEDTFILLDALEADAEHLRREKPKVVVEIGSGSGCVSAFIASILGNNEAAYLCTDINPHAAQCTFATGLSNKVHLEPILTSLLSSLLPRLQTRKAGSDGLVDVMLFNPPYVPTSAEEEEEAQRTGSLSGSWAGGSLGTRLLHALIEDGGRSLLPPHKRQGPEEEEEEGDSSRERMGGVESLLSSGGHFYCVAIRQNDPQDIMRRLERRGLDASIVLDRKAGREHLFVIRGTKRSIPRGIPLWIVVRTLKASWHADGSWPILASDEAYPVPSLSPSPSTSAHLDNSDDKRKAKEKEYPQRPHKEIPRSIHPSHLILRAPGTTSFQMPPPPPDLMLSGSKMPKPDPGMDEIARRYRARGVQVEEVDKRLSILDELVDGETHHGDHDGENEEQDGGGDDDDDGEIAETEMSSIITPPPLLHEEDGNDLNSGEVDSEAGSPTGTSIPAVKAVVEEKDESGGNVADDEGEEAETTIVGMGGRGNGQASPIKKESEDPTISL